MHACLEIENRNRQELMFFSEKITASSREILALQLSQNGKILFLESNGGGWGSSNN